MFQLDIILPCVIIIPIMVYIFVLERCIGLGTLASHVSSEQYDLHLAIFNLLFFNVVGSAV